MGQTTHDKLKKRGRDILRQMGFNDPQIFEEYHIARDNPIGGLRIDVAGIQKGNKVAVECGNTLLEKVAWLRLYFDVIILLPYKSKLRINGQHAPQFLEKIKLGSQSSASFRLKKGEG